MITICEVHRLINNDTTPRECVWCSMCQAWICKEDLHRWDRRAKAALLNKTQKPTTLQTSSGCGCGKKN